MMAALLARSKSRTPPTNPLSSNRILLLISFQCLLLLPSLSSSLAFSLSPPPVLGITSLLFPVRQAQVQTLADLASEASYFSYKTQLADTAAFFVDSFWTAKVGGGARELTDSQYRQLLQSQAREFQARYNERAVNPPRQTSQLLLIQRPSNDNSDDNPMETLACAGVELDTLRPPTNVYDGVPFVAPLMSNLAVSRSYRRRGLAEQLVRAVEEYVQTTWPEQDGCFLLVERRNVGAVKLYQKLGYQTMWTDSNAQTLLPDTNGSLRMVPTVLLCMKKTLRPRFRIPLFSK